MTHSTKLQKYLEKMITPDPEERAAHKRKKANEWENAADPAIQGRLLMEIRDAAVSIRLAVLFIAWVVAISIVLSIIVSIFVYGA